VLSIQGLSMIVSKEQWVGFSSFQLWDIENCTNFANKLENSVKITLEKINSQLFFVKNEKICGKENTSNRPSTNPKALFFIFLQKLFKLPIVFKRLPFEGLKFEP
jgi:hypothetical protein